MSACFCLGRSFTLRGIGPSFGLSLPLGCLLAVYLFVGFNVGVLDVDGGTTGGVQTAARRVRSNLSVIATGGAEDKLTASIAGDIFSAGGRCVAKHPLGI